MEFGTVGPNDSPNGEATPTAREKRRDSERGKRKEKKRKDGTQPKRKEKREKKGVGIGPIAEAAASVKTARVFQWRTFRSQNPKRWKRTQGSERALERVGAGGPRGVNREGGWAIKSATKTGGWLRAMKPQSRERF